MRQAGVCPEERFEIIRRTYNPFTGNFFPKPHVPLTSSTERFITVMAILRYHMRTPSLGLVMYPALDVTDSNDDLTITALSWFRDIQSQTRRLAPSLHPSH